MVVILVVVALAAAGGVFVLRGPGQSSADFSCLGHHSHTHTGQACFGRLARMKRFMACGVKHQDQTI